MTFRLPRGAEATIPVNRRGALGLGAGAVATIMVRPARAQEAEHHGMSAFGDLKYPPDFKHFDYVNPDAPKGGIFSQISPTRQFNQNFLTFNSLNSLHPEGRCRAGHGSDLRHPDGPRHPVHAHP